MSNYILHVVDYNNYLQHYGVKGMKWGIKRTPQQLGNCITMEDTNGNRKLLKKRHEAKIDCVAAMMYAYIAYKLNKEAFE